MLRPVLSRFATVRPVSISQIRTALLSSLTVAANWPSGTPSAMAQHRPNLDALIDRWAVDNQVHVTKQARKEAHALELRSVEVGATGELEGAQPRGLGRSFWIERFPTIRLVVEPTAPRDYSVSINGEDCPP